MNPSSTGLRCAARSSSFAFGPVGTWNAPHRTVVSNSVRRAVIANGSVVVAHAGRQLVFQGHLVGIVDGYEMVLEVVELAPASGRPLVALELCSGDPPRAARPARGLDALVAQ